MCGIIGAAGKLSVNEERVVKDLLYMDQLRGPHSTGLAAVGLYTGRVSSYKRAVGAEDFLGLKKANELFQGVSKVFIGHNRFKTKGAINNVNAHPFEHGNIIGVHNGTLINQSLLPSHTLFEVDSENIIFSLNEIGVESTHEKLDGAFALVWWDSGNSTLNMMRNNERDLFYAVQADGKAIYWASEKHMLLAALSRRNISWRGVHMVPVNQHVYWHLPQNNINKEFDLNKPSKKKMPPYVKPKPPVTAANSRWGRGYRQQGTQTSMNTMKPSMGNVTPISRPNGGTNTGGSDAFVPPFLKDLGYNFNDKCEDDFTINAVSGERAYGATMSGNNVSVSCFTSLAAKELLEACKEGKYFRFSKITGYCTQSLAFQGKGCVLTNINYLTTLTFGEDPLLLEKDTLGDLEDDYADDPDYIEETHTGKLLTEKQFDDKYDNCSWCSSPLFFKDKDIITFGDNAALCGDCSNNQQAMHTCGLNMER